MFSRSPIVLASVLVASMASHASAQGLDRLHKQAVEGHRMCMKSHYHYMSSGAWPSKAMAMATAKRRWEGFTATEYGRSWGALRHAASVAWACGSVTTHRGMQWSCELKARPCRPL